MAPRPVLASSAGAVPAFGGAAPATRLASAGAVLDAAAASAPSVYCSALTKKGEPCKGYANTDSQFCTGHSNQLAANS